MPANIRERLTRLWLNSSIRSKTLYMVGIPVKTATIPVAHEGRG